MGQGSGDETEVAASPSGDVGRAAAPMARRARRWQPFRGDQPLSFLRQTAFPAPPSARSTTAPTAGPADASAPCASPANPVSPAELAEPSLQPWDSGIITHSHPGSCPKAEVAGASVPAGTQTAFLPSFPPIPVGCSSPYRHPEGMGAVFFMRGAPQTKLLCCPTDPDTGISDAEPYHTYSELTNPQDQLSKEQWDDLGSSTSPCSQASDDEAKTGSPVKAGPFPIPKKDDFALPSLSLITTSAGDREVGKQVAESSQSYAGTHGQAGLAGGRGEMHGYGGLGLEQVQGAHVDWRGATLQGRGSSLPFVPSWICSVPPVPLHVCQGGGWPCVWVMALHVCQWLAPRVCW